MLFKLEDELNKASGSKYKKASSNWGEKVAVARGRQLITGKALLVLQVLGKLSMTLSLIY